MWDAYISYASEDKQFVRPLAEELARMGLKVWYDEFELKIGDSIRHSIDKGLSDSRFGIVILSPSFFTKQWPVMELDTITANEKHGHLRLLPVWHNVTADDVARFSPILADRNAISTEGGIEDVADKIVKAVKEDRLASFSADSSIELDIVRDILLRIPPDAVMRIGYALPTIRGRFFDISVNSTPKERVERLIEYSSRTGTVAALAQLVQREFPDIAKDLSLLTEENVRRVKAEFQAIKNPYIAGNPVRPSNPSVFLGRYDVASAIMYELKSSITKPSILLYGRRRMGKTSALLNIATLIRDPDFVPVYVSVQSSRFHNDRNFCYYIAREIIDKLSRANADIRSEIPARFLDKGEYGTEAIVTLSEFCEELQGILERHNRFCLILIDEYEEIDFHIDKGISRELLIELRDILQHRSRIMFLFAGTHYLRDLSKVNWSEIFINVKTLKISFLTRDEGFRLLTGPVPDIEFESESIVEKVLDITGCQPYLLQAVASHIINALNRERSYSVSEAIVAGAVAETLKTSATYFDYLWESECKTERHRELLKSITRKERRCSLTDLKAYPKEVEDLVQRDILKKEHSNIRVTMPILTEWMAANGH